MSHTYYLHLQLNAIQVLPCGNYEPCSSWTLQQAHTSFTAKTAQQPLLLLPLLLSPLLLPLLLLPQPLPHQSCAPPTLICSCCCRCYRRCYCCRNLTRTNPVPPPPTCCCCGCWCGNRCPTNPAHPPPTCCDHKGDARANRPVHCVAHCHAAWPSQAHVSHADLAGPAVVGQPVDG
jgi:hypothetical protein